MSYPKLTPVIAKGSTEPRYVAERFADFINVKDFGAVGDGVTNDSNAINNALEVAASARKAVLFPTASYAIEEITIPNGVKLVDGAGSTLVRTKTQTNRSLDFSETENLIIKDLNVITKDDTIYGNAVRGLGVSNLTLNNIYIKSSTPHNSNYYGNWGLTLSGSRINISDLYIDTFACGEWGDGIHFGQVKDLTLDNFKIYSGDDSISLCQHYPVTGEWSEEATENILISNGILCSSGYSCIKIDRYPVGVAEEDSTQHTVKDVCFSNVKFDAGQHNMLVITDYSGYMVNDYDNIVFDGCIVDDDNATVANIIVDGYAKTNNLIFQSCIFKRIYGTGSYAQIQKVKNLVFSGCTFEDTSSGSTDFYIADTQTTTFKNNYFEEAQTSNHLIRVYKIGRLNLISNILIDKTSGSTAMVDIENMNENTHLFFVGNTILGSTNPLYFPSPESIAELVSVGNYYGGNYDMGRLYSITATVKEISDSRLYTGICKPNGYMAKGRARDGGVSLIGSPEDGYGSALYLRGDKTSNLPGAFSLHAKSAADGSYGQSADKAMTGKPDGTLTWNGSPLQTSSDERIKTAMSNIPETMLAAWGDVRWGQYKMLESIKAKGDSARLHLGLIAQRVKEAFDARGLDVCMYGILCHEVQEASGDNITPHASVDEWQVRYDEAFAMESVYLRWRIEQLESRLAALEAQ